MIRRLTAGLLVAIATISLVVGCRDEQKIATIETSGRAYLAQCAVCHGVHGDGDGPLASEISGGGKAPPGDLRSARIAALGRAGVREAIESGVHLRKGSTMPAWGPHLGAQWIDRIADYVIAMPSAGERGREAVVRYLEAPAGAPSDGRRVYVMYCSGCHGPQGAGDGFFSPSLEERMKPAALGSTALSELEDDELLELIESGGTHAPDAPAMPGWLHFMSADEHQALAAYLRTLPESDAGK